MRKFCRKNLAVLLLFMSLFLVSFILLAPNSSKGTTIVLKHDIDIDVGLRVVSSRQAGDTHQTIPKIIHQMYKSDSIPDVYIPYIKTWIAHHPSWKYWFWSDLDARRLVLDHYPEYLDMYDSYSNNLLRSDAARYFILHHFGGIYADMDMESYRPVDKLLTKYTMILSQEPNEQSLFLHNMSTIVMNAWMASAKKHPFFEYVIQALPESANLGGGIGNTIRQTGPIMLQYTLTKYVKEKGCNDSDQCGVYVAPSDMFMPTRDSVQAFEHRCKNNKITLEHQKEACKRLKKIKFNNKVPANSYGNHRFLHIGYANGNFKSKSTTIDHIVPHIKRYSTFEHGSECSCS